MPAQKSADYLAGDTLGEKNLHQWLKNLVIAFHVNNCFAAFSITYYNELIVRDNYISFVLFFQDIIYLLRGGIPFSRGDYHSAVDTCQCQNNKLDSRTCIFFWSSIPIKR